MGEDETTKLLGLMPFGCTSRSLGKYECGGHDDLEEISIRIFGLSKISNYCMI